MRSIPSRNGGDGDGDGDVKAGGADNVRRPSGATVSHWAAMAKKRMLDDVISTGALWYCVYRDEKAALLTHLGPHLCQNVRGRDGRLSARWWQSVTICSLTELYRTRSFTTSIVFDPSCVSVAGTDGRLRRRRAATSADSVVARVASQAGTRDGRGGGD